jgi:serine/threonine protein kinase
MRFPPPNAQKIKFPDHPRLAALAGKDAEGQDVRIYYHKKPFDWGMGSQVFAAYDQHGSALALKRISLLPPSHPKTIRAWLHSHPGREQFYQDSQSHRGVWREVRGLRAGEGPLATFTLLRTHRGSVLSKYFIAMQPMSGDLLEVVHLLADQPLALREAVATHALQHILRDLVPRHSADVVHGDIRAENILCRTGQGSRAHITLADFGHSHVQRDPAQLHAAIGADLQSLGWVILMLLLPLTRGQPLAERTAAWRAAAKDVSSLAPLLDTLLTGSKNCSATNTKALFDGSQKLWGAFAESLKEAAHTLLQQVHLKAAAMEPHLAKVRQACAEEGIIFTPNSATDEPEPSV